MGSPAAAVRANREILPASSSNEFPSGRLFGGAVDHFVGDGNVREGGLTDLPGALAPRRHAPQIRSSSRSQFSCASRRSRPAS